MSAEDQRSCDSINETITEVAVLEEKILGLVEENKRLDESIKELSDQLKDPEKGVFSKQVILSSELKQLKDNVNLFKKAFFFLLGTIITGIIGASMKMIFHY
jgi:hypothetical protein